MIISTVSFAEDDYHAFAYQALQNANKQTAIYQNDVALAKEESLNIIKPYQTSVTTLALNSHKILGSSGNDASQENNKAKMSSILIFVSFSMPDQSLIAYLHDAKMIHASVIIRGLINNSFQETFKKMSYLIKASGGGGMLLDPVWFKRFKITTVPAVVILPKNSACFSDATCDVERDFDIIRGNITLSSALRSISHQESVGSDTAKNALDKIEGRI